MIDKTSTVDSGNATRLIYPVANGREQIQVEVPEYFSRKAIWMRALALLMLVAFSPIILLCMLLVSLTTPGPTLFRQKRVGKDGKPFEILKIRTMYHGAEDLSGPVLCQPGDSRITPIGRFLRFLHLDELPQLVNVARGEMCLIGPRPERPDIIRRYRLNEIVPGFAERTKVLPGVTGLAQINLPADQSAACYIPKVQLDLEYIATSSANLDIRILLCTALRMIGVRHGRAVRLLRLTRPTAVEASSRRDKKRMIGNRRPGMSIGELEPTLNARAVIACSSHNGHENAQFQPLESAVLDSADGYAIEPVEQLPASDWHPRKAH